MCNRGGGDCIVKGERAEPRQVSTKILRIKVEVEIEVRGGGVEQRKMIELHAVAIRSTSPQSIGTTVDVRASGEKGGPEVVSAEMPESIWNLLWILGEEQRIHLSQASRSTCLTPSPPNHRSVP